MADLQTRSKFRTQQSTQWKTDPKREMTHCNMVPFFWSNWQDIWRYFDKQCCANKKGFPGHLLADNPDAEAKTDWCITTSTVNITNTSSHSMHPTITSLRNSDRGLFCNPHAVALCLSRRRVDGMGNIRSTAEALDPVVWSISVWTVWNKNVQSSNFVTCLCISI